MHRNQNHAGLMPQSLRATIGRKTIDLFSTLRRWNLRNLTLQQECYLTSTRDFFRNTHGSLMLPPRQPRVFARLGSLATSVPSPAVRGIFHFQDGGDVTNPVGLSPCIMPRKCKSGPKPSSRAKNWRQKSANPALFSRMSPGSPPPPPGMAANECITFTGFSLLPPVPDGFYRVKTQKQRICRSMLSFFNGEISSQIVCI